MIDAVVFDLDGVLVDSESACYRLAAELAGRSGGHLSRADYARFVGVAPSEFWSWLRDVYGLNQSLERLLAYKEQRLLDSYRAPAWMPGAVEQLRALADAGLPLGIASSSPRVFIEAAMRASGLLGYLDAVVSVDDPEVERPKPAPDVYLEACTRLGTEPAATAAVEDSPTGALAAASARMKVFVVANEWTEEALFPSGVERLGSLGELSTALGIGTR